MTKRHSKRLFGLLPEPAKVFNWKLRDIKDLDKLELIYISEQWHYYIPMCRMIIEYGEFEFFRDLLIYLKHHFSGFDDSEAKIDSVYDRFIEIYFDKCFYLFNPELA